MAAVQDVPRIVLQAILGSQSPQAAPQQRKDAVAFLEQVRIGHQILGVTAAHKLVPVESTRRRT